MTQEPRDEQGATPRAKDARSVLMDGSTTRLTGRGDVPCFEWGPCKSRCRPVSARTKGSDSVLRPASWKGRLSESLVVAWR